MAQTAVITIVDMDFVDDMTLDITVALPGLLGKEIHSLHFRIAAPTEATDYLDWLRQALASACEAI
jgi:hypothetical protein